MTALFILASVEGQILRYSNYVAPPPSTVLVTSINVFGTGNATTIATNGGTLQMLKKTLPTNAADTSATWSRTNGSGTANISAGGLLTALTNGTVTARATANDGSAVYGEEEITISNQVAYGSELISNGAFADATGWTTNWSPGITGGVASGAAEYTYLQQSQDVMTAPGVEVSTTYKLEFDITGSLAIIIRDTNSSVTYITTTTYTSTGGEGGTGHYILEFTTGGSVGDGGLRFFTFVNNTGTIDNISLKEVL